MIQLTKVQAQVAALCCWPSGKVHLSRKCSADRGQAEVADVLNYALNLIDADIYL
jgi:hypothetical protein